MRNEPRAAASVSQTLGGRTIYVVGLGELCSPASTLSRVSGKSRRRTPQAL